MRTIQGQCSDPLPQTDEDVIAWFHKAYPDQLISACVIGIFQCHRAQGISILDAYKKVLSENVNVHPSQTT